MPDRNRMRNIVKATQGRSLDEAIPEMIVSLKTVPRVANKLDVNPYSVRYWLLEHDWEYDKERKEWKKVPGSTLARKQRAATEVLTH